MAASCSPIAELTAHARCIVSYSVAGQGQAITFAGHVAARENLLSAHRPRNA